MPWVDGPVQPPDEISQGPEREPLLLLPPLPRWPPEIAAFWVMAGVLAVASVLVIADIVTGHRPPSPVPSAKPSISYSTIVVSGGLDGAGGSVSVSGSLGNSLVHCDEDSWWHLGPNWQSDSLRAGPLWFVGAREEGYLRPGKPGAAGTTGASVPSAAGTPGASVPGAAGTPGASVTSVTASAGDAGNESPDNWLMVVHVDPGAVVMLSATAAEAPYFQLIDGEPVGTYTAADGSGLLLFQPCQPAGPARPGWVDLYNLGFHLAPGRSAVVEVVPLGLGTKPTWLTFTAPG